MWRALQPFLLQLHDCKSFKEMLLAGEITFERIDKNRLSKPPWAAQIIVFYVAVDELPYKCGLVNIQKALASDFFKRLQTYG